MPLSDTELTPPPPPPPPLPNPTRMQVLEFLRRHRIRSRPWFSSQEIFDEVRSRPHPSLAKAQLIGEAARVLFSLVTAKVATDTPETPVDPKPKVDEQQAERERVENHLAFLVGDGFVESKLDSKGVPHYQATRRFDKPREE